MRNSATIFNKLKTLTEVDKEEQLLDVDDKVDKLKIDSAADQDPTKHVSDVVLSHANSLLRRHIIYLTPRQDRLHCDPSLSNQMINGPAGTGKTILTKLKVAELVHNPLEKDPIVVLAPVPAHLMYANYFTDNNIPVNMPAPYDTSTGKDGRGVECTVNHYKLSLSTSPGAQVSIFPIKHSKFPFREPSEWQSAGRFHLFIDDAQAAGRNRGECILMRNMISDV